MYDLRSTSVPEGRGPNPSSHESKSFGKVESPQHPPESTAASIVVLAVNPDWRSNRPSTRQFKTIRAAIHAAWFHAVRSKIRVEILEEADNDVIDMVVRLHGGIYEDDLVFMKSFPSNLRLTFEPASSEDLVEIVYNESSQTIPGPANLILNRLSIRNLASDGLPTYHVTDGAKLTLNGCQLTCPGHACISASSAEVTLVDCHFNLYQRIFIVEHKASLTLAKSTFSKASISCGIVQGSGSRLFASDCKFVRCKNTLVRCGAVAVFDRCEMEGEWTPVKDRPAPWADLFGALAVREEGASVNLSNCSFKYFESCLTASLGGVVEAADNVVRDCGLFAVKEGDASLSLKHNIVDSVAFLGLFQTSSSPVDIFNNQASNALHHDPPAILTDDLDKAKHTLTTESMDEFELKRIDKELLSSKSWVLDRRDRAIYAKDMKKRLEDRDRQMSVDRSLTPLFNRNSFRIPPPSFVDEAFQLKRQFGRFSLRKRKVKSSLLMTSCKSLAVSEVTNLPKCLFIDSPKSSVDSKSLTFSPKRLNPF